MKKYLSDELTLLTAKLMLCNSKHEIIGLSNEFGQLIEKVIENEKKSCAHLSTTPEKAITATIKFTKSEVANMAKTFKKEFIAHGLVAHVIKRESGKGSYCYEIRYRKNGYNISASSTDLEEAKEKFIFMTSTPSFVGSNPATPAKKNRTFVYQKFCFCLSKPQACYIIWAFCVLCS